MTLPVGVLAQVGLMAHADQAAAAAAACEDAGAESIWLPEHAVLPLEDEGRYPYTSDGRLPMDPHTSLPDPLVWLGAAATATARLRLGTAFIGAAARNPLVLAKQVASLEALAPGRVDLGLGVGWSPGELRAGGIDPSEGPARLEETLHVLRGLWAGASAHRGEFWAFDDLVCEPQPLEPLPIHVEASDTNGAALAGRAGDGLLMRHIDRATTLSLIGAARTSVTEAGRSTDEHQITVVVDPAAGVMAELEELGVDRVVAILPELGPDRFARVVDTMVHRWSR